MTAEVWDASALLLLLQREPGWSKLAPRLGMAVISSVNLAEVAGKLMDSGISARETRELLESLSLRVHDFSAELAFLTGELRTITRPRGLSLGDRACLALARHLGLKAVTADRAWAGLLPGVHIEVVR